VKLQKVLLIAGAVIGVVGIAVVVPQFRNVIAGVAWRIALGKDGIDAT
jgi:hypothetical protein